MSWKSYQISLNGHAGPKRRGVVGLSVALGLSAFGGLTYGLFGVQWFEPETAQVAPVQLTPPENDQRTAKLEMRGLVTLAHLSGAQDEVRVKKGEQEWTLELTIQPDLQKFIQKKLEKYRVDWAGIAVLDPSTGEVLALGSHSEKEPSGGNLALRSTFPAASIFKIVTAAAALEDAGYRRESTVAFNGSMYGISRRQVMRDSGRSGLTLGQAFGKSANIVFGKIAARDLDARSLSHYADKFGFNSTIPFDLEIPASAAEIPNASGIDEARTAAGFGNVNLSPLHGALLAGSILNDGQMLEPLVVRRALDAENRVRYEARPSLWKTPVTPVTAREMKKMMLATIEEGTARKAFRKARRDPVLSRLVLGGKTGSLSGKSPPGRNEWFVGYAKSATKEIAIGMVIVNDKVWRVKPSEFAKEVYEYYFSPRPVLEARAPGRSAVGTP